MVPSDNRLKMESRLFFQNASIVTSFCAPERKEIVSLSCETSLEEVEAVFSVLGESDGLVSVHDSVNAIHSSSSAKLENNDFSQSAKINTAPNHKNFVKLLHLLILTTNSK